MPTTTARQMRYASVADLNATQHRELVMHLFPKIVPRYDFLNHFLSFGRDRAWRRLAVKQIQPPQGSVWMDVATGTADLALEAVRQHPDSLVLAVDFVTEMIRLGQKKVDRMGATEHIRFVLADAMHLPAVDGSVDVVSVAFGLRNMADRPSVLHEFYRVLKPGGKLLILEMALPQKKWQKTMFSFYLRRVIPTIAALFSPHAIAYAYLGDSIANFPPAGDIIELMRKAGFIKTACRSLTFGVPHLFVGQRSGSAER